MKKFAALLLMIGLAFNPALAEEYKEGVNYKAITEQPTASGDNVEVLEFFWYGCPHCNTFEPYLNEWKKNKAANVTFTRVPAVFRPSWKVQARAYYALEAMGVIEDVHHKIFDAIHKDRKRLDSLKAMSDFLAANGVDKDEFKKNYSSFSTDGKVRKANKLLKNYNITGVPTIAVNGKYVVTGTLAGSYENMVKIMDHLIAKESK